MSKNTKLLYRQIVVDLSFGWLLNFINWLMYLRSTPHPLKSRHPKFCIKINSESDSSARRKQGIKIKFRKKGNLMIDIAQELD